MRFLAATLGVLTASFIRLTPEASPELRVEGSVQLRLHYRNTVTRATGRLEGTTLTAVTAQRAGVRIVAGFSKTPYVHGETSEIRIIPFASAKLRAGEHPASSDALHLAGGMRSPKGGYFIVLLAITPDNEILHGSTLRRASTGQFKRVILGTKSDGMKIRRHYTSSISGVL